MPTLKDLVEALSASWPVALAALLGTGGILLGEALGLRYLRTLPEWALGATFVAMVFAAAVLAVSALRGVITGVSAMSGRRKRTLAVAAHVARLDDLPQAEKEVLAYLTLKGTQVFLAQHGHHRLEPLVAKGYVKMLGGTHSILQWPYKIPDHIWAELPERVSTDVDRSRMVNPFEPEW